MVLQPWVVETEWIAGEWGRWRRSKAGKEEQGRTCRANALQAAAGLWDALISQVAMVRKK